MKTEEKIKIAFVGDIFPGECDFTLNYGIRSQFENHKGQLWINKIKNILGENDIIIGNLESPLVESEKVIKKSYYGNPDFAFFLKSCGINILNVANNHIMEQGDFGFNSTLKFLNNAGINIIGNIKNSLSNVLHLNIKGLKISLAGFSNVDLNKGDNNNLAVLNENNVFCALKLMSENLSDIKILCFHWGNEYIHIPSLEQRQMAYKFIDAGADIIAGHHPHVIQPYEKYNNGHIVYSLGNFMFNYIRSNKFSIGQVALFELTKNKSIKVEIKGVKLSFGRLVETYPILKFKSFYQKIVKKYDALTKLSFEKYSNYYFNSLHCNHFWARIMMKTSIINELFRIGSKNRIKFIKNVGYCYLKKFNLKK